MLDKQNKFEKTIEAPVPKKNWARSPALKLAQQKYYEKNKKKLVEDQLKYNYKYVRQKYTCDCGDVIQYSAKYLHTRSDRHKRRMDNIKNGIPAGHRKCNTSYPCECGSKILSKNRNQHFKSAKHQNYLKSKLLPIPEEPEEPETNICMVIEDSPPLIRIV